MWNTILHDTDPSADISAESSPPLSEGEEMGVEGALMSPQSSTSEYYEGVVRCDCLSEVR